MATTLRRMHANMTRIALLPYFPPKVDVERRVARHGCLRRRRSPGRGRRGLGRRGGLELGGCRCRTEERARVAGRLERMSEAACAEGPRPCCEESAATARAATASSSMSTRARHSQRMRHEQDVREERMSRGGQRRWSRNKLLDDGRSGWFASQKGEAGEGEANKGKQSRIEAARWSRRGNATKKWKTKARRTKKKSIRRAQAMSLGGYAGSRVFLCRDGPVGGGPDDGAECR